MSNLFCILVRDEEKKQNNFGHLDLGKKIRDASSQPGQSRFGDHLSNELGHVVVPHDGACRNGHKQDQLAVA